MTTEATAWAGWWQVPDDQWMSATALRELEFPRSPTPASHGTVDGRDWRDKPATIAVYDARRCPPTTATGRQLAAAAAKSSRPRQCADCCARPQRPLAVDVGDRPLCPACRQIQLMRNAQTKAGRDQAAVAAQVAEVLTWPRLAVVQVAVTDGGRSPAGRVRPPVSARITAVDAHTDARLLDLHVCLLSRRSPRRDPDAADPATVRDQLVALAGRPLVCWHGDELNPLYEIAPSTGWARDPGPGYRRTIGVAPPPLFAAATASTMWRAQLDQRRNRVHSLAPGSPDRLLEHLRRIAGTTADR